MSAAPFRLVASPSFACDVRISVPGQSEPAILPVHFRHQGKRALQGWIESLQTKSAVDALHEVLEEWSVVDEERKPVGLTVEAIGRLLDLFPAAGGEIIQQYLAALTESRLGN